MSTAHPISHYLWIFFVVFKKIPAKRATHLRVAYVPWPPWVTSTLINNETVIEGAMMDIFGAIASSLKMTYDLTPAPDLRWGGKGEDGTWSGMLGMLDRNESDLALGPFAPTFERWEVAVFTNALSTGHYTMIGKLLPPEHSIFLYLLIFEWKFYYTMIGKLLLPEHSIFLYFLIFDWKVWAVLALSILVVSIVATFIMMTHSQKVKKRVISTLGTNVWLYAVNLIFEESAERTKNERLSKLTSLRILTCGWLLSAVCILMMTFQSLLTSSLAVMKVTPLVNSLQELHDNKKLIPIIRGGTILTDYFQTNTAELHRNLWKRMKHHTVTNPTTEELLTKAEDGTHILFGDDIAVLKLLTHRYKATGKCMLHIAEEPILPYFNVMAMRKSLDKDLIEEINIRFTRLAQGQVSEYWLSPISANYTACKNVMDSSARALTLDDVLGVFLLWLLGVVISGAGLIYEKLNFC